MGSIEGKPIKQSPEVLYQGRVERRGGSDLIVLVRGVGGMCCRRASPARQIGLSTNSGYELVSLMSREMTP